MCLQMIFLPNQCPSRESYFNQLQTLIDSYKFSFFPIVIRLWNSLPPFVINSLTLDYRTAENFGGRKLWRIAS